MCVISVTEANKKLIFEFLSKSIYLHVANSFELISKFTKHKYLVEKPKISSNTLIKYNNSSKVFRNKYIIYYVELSKRIMYWIFHGYYFLYNIH